MEEAWNEYCFPWSGYRVSRQQILKGGVLHFEMKAKEK